MNRDDALRAFAELRRSLARWDRTLFRADLPQSTRLLNAQYYHLWDRLILRMGEAVEHEDRASEIARLHRLACELEYAQERGQLPPRLVRKLVPRYPHG